MMIMTTTTTNGDGDVDEGDNGGDDDDGDDGDGDEDMTTTTTAVLIAFHLKRVVCGRWVEPRSQAPNIPMLSTAATLALPSTGGTTKFSFDYGGNLGGGGEVGGIYSK